MQSIINNIEGIAHEIARVVGPYLATHFWTAFFLVAAAFHASLLFTIFAPLDIFDRQSQYIARDILGLHALERSVIFLATLSSITLHLAIITQVSQLPGWHIALQTFGCMLGIVVMQCVLMSACVRSGLVSYLARRLAAMEPAVQQRSLYGEEKDKAMLKEIVRT